MLFENVIDDYGKPARREYRQGRMEIRNAYTVTFPLNIQITNGRPVKHIREVV